LRDDAGDPEEKDEKDEKDDEMAEKKAEEKASHAHDKRHKRKVRSFNMNMKVVFLHQLGDSVSSLFVLITALLLYFYPDQHWVVYIDPIVRYAFLYLWFSFSILTRSLIIVCVIVASVASVLRDCTYILVQRVPEEIEIASLQSDLEKVDGVCDVHDLHVWKLADTMVIASLHVTLFESERSKIEVAVDACKDVLHKFGIHSSTLQVEFQPPDPGVEVWKLSL
jgi:Co/Zn/Cd efflux system component